MISGIRLPALVLLFFSLSGFSQKQAVQFEVTFHESYCGGARPSDEMLAEVQKAKAYADQTLYLLPKKGKAIKIKTNKNGSVSIKLKDGTYQLFESWRTKHQSPNTEPLAHFDSNCLKLEWEKAAAEITVTSGKAVTTILNEIVEVCPGISPAYLTQNDPLLQSK